MNSSGSISVNQADNISLEFLLQCPVFWNAEKISDFLMTVHNKVQVEWAGLPTELKTPIFGTIDEIKNEAINSHILGEPDNNWKRVLDFYNDKHYTVITSRYVKGDVKPLKNVDNTCVWALLKIIRDKREHGGEMPLKYRALLDWFSKDGKLDNNLFVVFWMERFPKLCLFLWIQLYKLYANFSVDEQKKYFPKCTGNFQELRKSNLQNLMDSIHKALVNHLESGNLLTRYCAANQIVTVELRTFPVNLLVSESDCMYVCLTNQDIFCCWNEVVIKYSISTNYNTVLFLVISSSDEIDTKYINFEELQLFCKYKENLQLLILCNHDSKSLRENVTSVVKQLEVRLNVKYSEIPVSWDELRKSVQNQILRNQVKFYTNSFIALDKVLPENEQVRARTLSHLSGNFLNNLLKNRKPKLFYKYELPQIQENYKERQIYNCSFFPVTLFMKAPKYQYFVIGIPIDDKNSEETIRSKFRYGRLNIYNIVNVVDKSTFLEKQHENCRILLVKGTLQKVNQAFSAFPNHPSNQKEGIHYLEYVPDKEQFKYIASKGILPDTFAKVANENVKIDEAAFIKSVEERLVFIADIPGMGKSMMLKSLADKLSKYFPTRIVLYVDMNEFVEKVEIRSSDIVSSTFVVRAIIDLICSNTFEQELINARLQQKEVYFELMLDGLDEVKSSLSEVAFKILDIIQHQFYSVRTWVTLRDHMLPDISRTFNTLGYKMELFSKELQVDYLKSHWVSYYKRRGVNTDEKMLSKFENLAYHFLNLQLSVEDSEITGIPLHCRMIAEIYENKVLTMELEETTARQRSLIELYQQMVERKLEVFIKEKSKLKLDMSSYIANLIRSDMEVQHMCGAISLIISADLANQIYRILASGHDPLNNLHPEEKSVLEQGIIQQLHPPLFIHRTFAEYFLALFIFRVLAGKLRSRILEKDSVFQNVINKVMISESDQKEQPAKQSFCKFDYAQPVVCHFLNAMWEGTSESVSTELDMLLKMNETRMDSESYVNISSTKSFAYFYTQVARYPNHLAKFFASALVQHQYKFCQYVIQNYDKTAWYSKDGFGSEKQSMWHLLLQQYWPKLETNLERKAAEKFFKFVNEKCPTEFQRKDVYERDALEFFLDLYADWCRYNPDGRFGLTGTLVYFLRFFKKELCVDFNVMVNDEMNNNLVQKAVALNLAEIVVRVLLECGVDKLYTNLHKQTALHLAVKMQNLPVVKLLIEDFCIDQKAKDLSGKQANEYNTSMEIRNYFNAPKPRIWLEMCRFKNMNQACWMYNELIQQLLKSCSEKCYALEKDSTQRTLEIRHLPSDLVTKILDGRQYMEIDVSSFKTYAVVYFRWPSNARCTPFVTKENKSSTLLIAHKFSNIGIKKLFENCFDSKCKTLKIITSSCTDSSDQKKLSVIIKAYQAYVVL